MTRHHHRRPTPPDRAGRRSLRQRRDRERRALIVGLSLSALLHVLVIGLAGGWLTPERARPAPAGPVVVEPPRGMRAVDIVEVPTPEAETPPAPVPRDREPEPAASTQVAADRPAVRDTVRGDRRTAADRLAPRVVDARLWEPMVLIPREPTLSDVEARVGAAVELLSDSALSDAERALRARDWTVKDAEGGRWGISPGKLHLGSLTLPLPIYFAEEWDPTRAEWYDLEAAVDRGRILESFEARVKAIRERRDRERTERRKTGNGG